VVGEAEHRRTVGRGVGANALEHARAVVEAVGEHVHARFVPRHQLAVHPDLLGLLKRH
jgi:hypothetical protein